MLVALCAPRPVFISSGDTLGGVPAGDGWVDAKGMFLAGVEAGPVYRLLGKKGWNPRSSRRSRPRSSTARSGSGSTRRGTRRRRTGRRS
jgi:hypothetical protein